METNASMNFFPVLFEGSKTIDASYVGISQWYRIKNGVVQSAFKNPENETASPMTYSVNRCAPQNQEYAGNKWHWIEKLKGQYDYSQLAVEDAYVDYWKSLGIGMQMEIGATPSWANLNTTYDQPSGHRLGSFGEQSLCPQTWSNSGVKYFGIGVVSVAGWATDPSFTHRYTVYSTSNPSKKMSGRGVRTSGLAITSFNIGAGTGGVSGTWSTSGSAGVNANGTFTCSGGILVSYTIADAGYGYTTGETIVINSGNLGTNTFTPNKTYCVKLTIDTSSAGYDNSVVNDWFIKLNGCNLAPTDMADFADWCEFIFARNERPYIAVGQPGYDVTTNGWGGAVRYWMLRNEPSLEVTSAGTSQYFRDSAEKYAEMLRVAYQIGKKHNPLNMIQGPDGPYPFNNEFQMEYHKVGAITEDTNFVVTPPAGINVRSKLNGWYVLGSGIKRGTTVVSGEGTPNLIISKPATKGDNGAIYLRPGIHTNTASEILTADASGFNTASYGVTGNTTGAGTVGHEWVDMITSHAYIDDIYDNADAYTIICYEWLRFKKLLADLGINKPVWQTEHMKQWIVAPTPYQHQEDSLVMKRSFLLAVFAGGCSHWMWFGWGPGRASWNQNTAAGVAARLVWYNFFTGLFASPVIRVTMDYITKKITVTQANGTVTVV